MNMADGSRAGPPLTITLALTFGVNRLYLVGPREAPLWMRQRGPWRWALNVTWHRMDEVGGRWWVAQHGRDLVILGQGERPPLLLRDAKGPWQGMIPSGRQSIAVRLPRKHRYDVRPIGAVRDRGGHRSMPTGD
ncbi:MAG: hypothetical protein OWU84_08770 [Firmicutes bacterium]|nr:hypothetical protein [Bacillota bacterium]